MSFNPGGGSGNSSIAGSTDVALSSPQNTQILSYDQASAKWQNAASPTPSLANLPPGTMLGRVYSGSSWPARGTSRTDIIIQWIDFTGSAPAPPQAVANLDIIHVTTGGGGTPDPDIAAAIIANNVGNHDAIPRGVPNGYSWRESSDATAAGSTGWQGYGAVNLWGQIFPANGTSPNWNVRMQIRNPRLFWWLGGSNWTEAPNNANAGALGGAYYKGDFNQTATMSASPRHDGSGIYSATLQTLNPSNPVDAFHWWWEGQYPRIAKPGNAQGIVSCADIRLVPGDGQQNLGNNSYIANIGVDLFATPETVVGGPNGNPGIPQSRMIWVDGNWKRHYISTMSNAQLQNNPPTLIV